MAAIKAKYSPTYRAQMERIKNLPKWMIDFAKAQVKRDAINLIKEFKEGLIKNNFRLDPLKPATIRQKEKMNYPAPKRPLYGIGEDEPRSYMNMLRIRELKYGFKVYPSWAKHHKSDLKLRTLLEIHEYGKTFENKGGTLTVIPPRPAFRKAYERLLKKRKKLETEKVRRELNRFINQGKKDYFEKLKERIESDAEKLRMLD